MKIGLIGNINNNNFSLMRYFRDLGADAHLLLNQGDGCGTLEHFTPENDTWDIDKWRDYIHTTPVPNAPIAALDFPLAWVFGFRARLRTYLGLQDRWVDPVSKKIIRKAYGEYDQLVSAGITPAVLHRIGAKLDIFYPYSYKVEFLRSSEFTPLLEPEIGFRASIYRSVARRQALGIATSRVVISPDSGDTEKVLKAIGAKPLRLSIPMVYTGEPLPVSPPSEILRAAFATVEASSFSIMHHARLMWRRTDGADDSVHGRESKNNDWLLHALKRLIEARPSLNPLLIMVEYGPDVELTKRLADSIGVANRVLWLPRMARRDLMWLLSKVSVGTGEFLNIPRMIFGGTGWEALASGKPLLQGFQFEAGEFESIYGYPPPPLLPVVNEADVYRHMLDMADHPARREEMGARAAEWFEGHNGRGLAKQWLDLLTGGGGHREPGSDV